MSTDVTTRMTGEPEEPHGHTEPTPHHYVNYWGIFYALMALTVITVGISFIHFGFTAINIGLAMLVALVKGTFVARYFMHLKFEGKLILLIAGGPLILCVIMVVALIPDIGRAHTTAIDDAIGRYDKTYPADAKTPPAPNTPASPTTAPTTQPG